MTGVQTCALPISSPTAGLYLAQLGAEVIRVDHTAGGLDYDRALLTREGRSLAWENLNRAKKSVALDLHSKEGRALLIELVRATGVLITNLPVDSFLSHAAIAEACPELVSVRIMGWHDGRQAMDFTVNAASGYPLMTGPAEWDAGTAPPVNQVLPAWDFITGAYCAFALLAGLRHRDATGQGIEMRVPLGDVAIGTAANSGAMAEMLYRGGDRERLGNAIWGALGRDLVSRDGQRFMVAALTAKQWKALLDGLDVRTQITALEGSSGLSFATSDANRFDQREAIFAIMQSAAGQLDYANLARRLTDVGATFEHYRTMFEAAQDPVLVSDNPLFGPAPANPSGFDYPATRSFLNVPGAPRGDPRAAPYLGQHSEQVLGDVLGLGANELTQMINTGLVATSDKDRT